MARIRTVKPEFWQSATVERLSFGARLTFIGLWNYCDDEGRGKDDARLIKATVWPMHDAADLAQIEAWLRELRSVSLIIRYEVARRRFLAVRAWGEHQKVDHPKPSTIPAPRTGRRVDEPSRDARETGANVSDGLALEVEQGTGNREQGTGNREGVAKVPAPPPDEAMRLGDKYLGKLRDDSPRVFASLTLHEVFEIAADEGIEPLPAARMLSDVWEWWRTAAPSRRWKSSAAKGFRTWCRREALKGVASPNGQAPTCTPTLRSATCPTCRKDSAYPQTIANPQCPNCGEPLLGKVSA